VILVAVGFLARFSAHAEDRSWADRLEYLGVAVEEPGYHIWGSSPVIGPDGRTHLFVARWPVATRFSGWKTHSEIARYVADRPEGPFSFREVVVKGTGTDGWDRRAPHNPTIQKVGDHYVLLYIANSGKEFPASQRIGMTIADSPEGPWTRAGEDGLILASPDDPSVWSYNSRVGVNNPALLQHPDGRFFLYYKAMTDGPRRMGVAISDKLEGPYIHHNVSLTSNRGEIEDGYAFIENGEIHLLTTDNGKSAGLLWSSKDGITFREPVLGYEPMSRYFPKDVLNVAANYRAKKFERPQVLMVDGKPAYLYLAGGANVNKGDGSCSYVFRIRDSED